jgi:hypothetical protein
LSTASWEAAPVVLICRGISSSCFSTELTQPLVEAGFNMLISSRPSYGCDPLELRQSAAQSAQALNETTVIFAMTRKNRGGNGDSK